MCNSNNCVNCGKDVSMYIEFGGPIGFQSLSHLGDGWVCSKHCKDSHDKKIKSQLDQLADPTTDLSAWLGIPFTSCT